MYIPQVDQNDTKETILHKAIAGVVVACIPLLSLGENAIYPILIMLTPLAIITLVFYLIKAHKKNSSGAKRPPAGANPSLPRPGGLTLAQKKRLENLEVLRSAGLIEGQEYLLHRQRILKNR